MNANILRVPCRYKSFNLVKLNLNDGADYDAEFIIAPHGIPEALTRWFEDHPLQGRCSVVAQSINYTSSMPRDPVMLVYESHLVLTRAAAREWTIDLEFDNGADLVLFKLHYPNASRAERTDILPDQE